MPIPRTGSRHQERFRLLLTETLCSVDAVHSQTSRLGWKGRDAEAGPLPLFVRTTGQFCLPVGSSFGQAGCVGEKDAETDVPVLRAIHASCLSWTGLMEPTNEPVAAPSGRSAPHARSTSDHTPSLTTCLLDAPWEGSPQAHGRTRGVGA